MSVESPSPNEEKGKTLKAGSYHTPVMLKECVEGLVTDPNGVYVDATFGGGGHSRGILEKLKNGRLIAFDQDIEAVKQAELIVHRSFTFCKANFQYLSRYLKWLGVVRVNGILADLGISSRQIDSPERGFSTRFDGPLDMRMNTALEKTAADVVAGYSEAELHRIFGRYGELKNARTTAKAVATARTRKPISTTAQLKEALIRTAPRGKENRYFAQVFQALRIEVNDELAALENFLRQCGEIVAPEGRLAVMSYHSLEDRPVKNYMQTGHVNGQTEKDFYGNKIAPFAALTRKPLTASGEELSGNARARSAKLRIAARRQQGKTKH